MDLEVSRQDLHRVAVHDQPPVALADGQARLRVDAFALTTNNITYAVFGDALRYWEFFPGTPTPAGAEDDPNWGRVPVWGFAEVVESRSPAATVGERVYGYLPMSNELVVTPGRDDTRGFVDLAAHRAAMASAYSQYQRVLADPVYRADREDHQMVLYPLFFTSFLVDDYVVEHEELGAEQIILSSASSKTAIGVAFQARHRGITTVGLTSPGNVAFVEGLGVYDQVLTYDDLSALGDAPAVYVDIAGNRDVTQAVHEQAADSLRASMTVGGTHWAHETETHAPLPGPTPEFFFAPAQIASRTKQWGRDGLDARLGEAWARYADWVEGWIEFRHVQGPAEVERVYLELLDGHAAPDVGFVCTLTP